MKDVYGYIYKITNKANGKMYIGQTNGTVSARFNRHIKLSATNNEVLYRAIRKYGVDNFIVETIDTANSKVQLDDKESFWIEKLKTFIGFIDCKGYNMTLGGDGRKGGSLSQETVIKIKEMLRDTNLSCADIGNKFNISGRNVSSIHEGYIYGYINVENYTHGSKRDIALRGERSPNTDFITEDVIKIKEVLRDTNLDYKEIAEMFDTNSNIIGRIYRGERWEWLEVDGFIPKMPRDNKFKKVKKMKNISNEDAKKIKELIVEGNLKQREIAEMFDVSRTVVTNIANGKRYSHIYVEGFNPNNTGRVKFALSEEQVLEIKRKSMTGEYNSSELCKEYNFHLSTLWDILNEKNYKSVILEGYSRDKVCFKNKKEIKKTNA